MLSIIVKEGDEIIISELEHHSNIVPWQMCCEYSGAVLKIIPLKDNGELEIKNLKVYYLKKQNLWLYLMF